jgi:hypothetical protein
MHPEDLMKPDLFSEIVLLGSGGADVHFTVADRCDCSYPSLNASQASQEDLCHQPFKSVPF